MKARIGRSGYQRCIREKSIVLVTQKIRRRGDELLAGVHQGAQDVVERSGRPHGHQDEIRRDRDAVLPVQPPGQGLAHVQMPRDRRVPVVETGGRRQLPQDAAKIVGRRRIRVSQGEVVNVVGSELGLHAPALFEHVLDHRESGHPCDHPV